MAALDWPVEVVAPVGAEAARTDGDTPEDLALRRSSAKAKEVAADRTGPSLVVGADTVVAFNGEVLGKPGTAADAERMLRLLRGRTHRVITGVTVIDVQSQRLSALSRSTDVAMRQYTDSEVAAYVASGEPFDKAGGYAVQDEAFRPAHRVDGCYLNVVGLPMCDLITLLERHGLVAPLRPEWGPPEECQGCPLRPEKGPTRR